MTQCGILFFHNKKELSSNIWLEKLSFKDTDWLEQAAEWAQKQWQNVGEIKNVKERINAIKKLIAATNKAESGGFYVLCRKNFGLVELVGMFVLHPCETSAIHRHRAFNCWRGALELDYVYVEESYRGLGLGRLIVTEAKRIAKEAGAKILNLETLTPALNPFYEQHGKDKGEGASVIGEWRYKSHPTEKLSYPLLPVLRVR